MHIKTSNQQKLDLGFYGYSCNWGVHIAGLYETEKERDEIIFGFLGTGALSGDLQLYAVAERTRENFKVEFSEKWPEAGKMLGDSSVFQLSTPKELYYPDGVFSPIAMDEGLENFYKESQENGIINVRATAEMVWALEAIPGRELLMVYESRLNYFIPGKPWISICLYNVTKFPGATIMNVLRTHPYTINRGVLMGNPYYQDPDIWLKENAPEYLPENIHKLKQ